MEHTDICFAPVLSPEEATQHPHNVERETFIEVDGVTQAAPAPRFSRSVNETPKPPPLAGQHTDAVLARFGFDADAVAKLRADGAVA
jgi:alpha-methylacyl-CoA racemase